MHITVITGTNRTQGHSIRRRTPRINESIPILKCVVDFLPTGNFRKEYVYMIQFQWMQLPMITFCIFQIEITPSLTLRASMGSSIQYNTIQYNTMGFYVAPFHLDHSALNEQ